MAAVRVWVPEAKSPGFAPPPISPFWHIAPYGAAGEPHTRLCALGRCRGGCRGECVEAPKSQEVRAGRGHR